MSNRTREIEARGKALEEFSKWKLINMVVDLEIRLDKANKQTRRCGQKLKTEILECMAMANLCPVDRTWALGIDIPDFCDWKNGQDCSSKKVKACWNKQITALEDSEQ